ncbi:hypothetical protein BDV96DRAFT_591793 [Lophiotrema nucula]|uniref:Uncharacterized protein n=1 Tax=Lophiotrema nucula TaxID=690887 RepID=A0A6A5YI94_9PLEO|nr:hypothetical protein BDV96DRAFT_591793 [Lophiotrema nucula]
MIRKRWLERHSNAKRRLHLTIFTLAVFHSISIVEETLFVRWHFFSTMSSPSLSSLLAPWLRGLMIVATRTTLTLPHLSVMTCAKMSKTHANTFAGLTISTHIGFSTYATQ